MLTYKMKGSTIAVLAFGVVAIGGATLARQHLAALPDQVQTPAAAPEAATLTPAPWRTPTAKTKSIEDALEIARDANAGRATSARWRPASAAAQSADAAADASGRIIDQAGRPVAGARFWVLAVKRPQGDEIGKFYSRLAAARQFNDLWMAWHDLPDAPPGSPPSDGGQVQHQPDAPPRIDRPATSDAGGRIRVEGIGVDRLVLALIEGPEIESKPAIIVTRPGPAMPVKDSGGLIVHGASFEHVAAPSRAIEGLVRDEKTGLPLPGVSIRAATTLSFTGLINYVRATSDARGRYRLTGIREGAEDRVVAIPPADGAYLSVSQRIQLGRGNGPATLDLSLKKGVWIKGRVTDAASGAPLDADLEYHAFLDNPHLGRNPGYEMKGTRTEPDGSFRLLGLPGRGFVAARAFDGRFVRGVGFAALFKGESKSNIVHAVHPLFTNSDEVSVVVGIEPAEDTETIACDLKASTGRTRTGTVLGPDGRPLFGFVAFGLKPGWGSNPPSSSSEFVVTALAPFEHRALVVRHDARKLIGTLLVAGDGDGALAVKLGPWSSVTATCARRGWQAAKRHRRRGAHRSLSRARPGRVSQAALVPVRARQRWPLPDRRDGPRGEVQLERPRPAHRDRRLHRKRSGRPARRGKRPGRPQGGRYDALIPSLKSPTSSAPMTHRGCWRQTKN